MQRLAELVIFAGRRREGPQAPPRIWRRLFHLTAGSSIPLAGIFAPELEFVLALTVLAWVVTLPLHFVWLRHLGYFGG